MPANNDTPWVLYGLLACSLALNVVLLFGGSGSERADAPLFEPPPEVPVAGAPAEPADQPREAAGAAADAEQDEDEPERGSGEWSILRGTVEHSLARTFQVEAGEAGDALSSVYTRLFVWDLDLRRDLQRGDSLTAVWRIGADGFPEIAAASLQSKKLGKAIHAYRWKMPGDTYASYWHPDGSEAALRLKNGPLDHYEQITSLLKDRPTHKGMDFKTPVGTEVRSPRAGTVTRVNWNWNANGNCIEVRFDDGVLAKFLHLSENRVQQGDKVSAGQVIALTGNTGRSTAPHLHYQLDRGEKTLDPLQYHGTERRSLTQEQLAAMRRDVAEFEKLLEGD
ncbi:MAG TPA: M23 family metallopeptidase [Candidatus Limnocylindrales bacterium]|nr:M23 family metallopeptidase [Candidatus Limnocylindrales bacterium]